MKKHVSLSWISIVVGCGLLLSCGIISIYAPITSLPEEYEAHPSVQREVYNAHLTESNSSLSLLLPRVNWYSFEDFVGTAPVRLIVRDSNDEVIVQIDHLGVSSVLSYDGSGSLEHSGTIQNLTVVLSRIDEDVNVSILLIGLVFSYHLDRLIYTALLLSGVLIAIALMAGGAYSLRRDYGGDLKE